MRKKEKKKDYAKGLEYLPIDAAGATKIPNVSTLQLYERLGCCNNYYVTFQKFSHFLRNDTQAYIIMLIFVLWTVKEVKKKSIQKR